MLYGSRVDARYAVLGVLALGSTILFLIDSVTELKPAMTTYIIRGVQPVNSSNQSIITEDIQVGSDVYWRSPRRQSDIMSEIQSISADLQKALQLQGSATGTTVWRAILLFLPSDPPKFATELKSFYLSLAVMRSKQPESVRTDLFVFTPGTKVDGIASDFGCAKADPAGWTEREQCIVISHEPLKGRAVPPGEPGNPLVGYANYIDSMLILSEFAYASRYDYLMRTDIDTFLTPGFANWTLPEGVHLAPGHGGYGHQNVNKHLSWVMTKKLGLRDEGLIGIGSTWYGRSHSMVAAARLTVAVMKWLHTQEFSEYEKFHASTDSWPYWHWPVILLYGGHVAVNQIPKEKLLIDKPSEAELDKPTSATDLLLQNAKHLHCYQSPDFFSKLRFHTGQYKNLSLVPYASMNTTQAYAGVIGISSDRLSLEELRGIIDKPSLEAKDWQRLEPK